MHFRQRILVLAALIAAPFVTLCQFTGLEWEWMADSEYGTTYRVYAIFDSPSDYVTAVFATESIYNDPPLSITAENGFFQSSAPLGEFAIAVNPGFFMFIPDMAFDSWLTIGSGPGVDGGVSQVGLDAELAQFASGADFNTEGSIFGGSWYSIISPPFTAGPDGKILLAQLTSTGPIDISLNLQWKNGAGIATDEFGATLTIGAVLVGGCMDPTACNFNEAAEENDGSCEYPGACDNCSGATDGTGTILDGDSDNDGVCDIDEVPGCTNVNACNFDAAATDDDGSCLVPNETNCEFCLDESNLGILDADSDGVCDAEELLGCTDPNACNYDSTPTTDSDNSQCIFPEGCETCTGATDGTGEVIANDDDGDGVCNANEIPGCTDSLACNYNLFATDPASCDYADGNCETCSGPTDGTGMVLTLDADGDGVCDSDEISGCTDTEACNFEEEATDLDDSCLYPSQPCEACGDAGNVILLDDDGDGVCNADEILGCTNPAACNYNSQATDSGTCFFPEAICETCSGQTDGTGEILSNDEDSDGVCDTDEIAGCQNVDACNYNQWATDPAICLFPTGCESCSGEADGSGVVLANDQDADGICDANEIAGCQDPFACNYNSDATDSAPCIFAEGCESCSGSQDGTGFILPNDIDGDGICDSDEIAGCQDATACNYNASATDGDIPCLYASGCESCSGSADGTGYILNGDADGDGVCDVNELAGCTYALACNYNVNATDDDGSCVYADPNSCESCTENGSIVISDADGDGICDADELLGCTDSEASNYNCEATESDDSCEYPPVLIFGCTYEWAFNYDPGANSDDGSCQEMPCVDVDADSICDLDEIHGCTDPDACNFDASATEDIGCTYPDEHYDCNANCINDTDDDGICDEYEIPGCTDWLALNYLQTATDDDGTCDYPEPPVEGCTYVEACNYDTEATSDDGSCDYSCFGCTDPEATNFDEQASVEDGSCTYDSTILGCTYAEACNFSSTANTDDGSCDYSCFGCTDPEATNYEDQATVDDGSCTYDSTILGCTYPEACNFNSTANTDDGSCDYSCFGCTDPEAANYDDQATVDAGSCTYDSTILGCTYPEACNFSSTANTDNGSCDYSCFGCTDPEAANYDDQATVDDGSCTYDSTMLGCTYPEACNFSSTANTDDGSCDYSCFGCTDPEAMNYDDQATVDDGSCTYDSTILGCTYPEACNFSSTANTDDSSCDYSCFGCTDPEATNYDDQATVDDGSCTYDSTILGCTYAEACNFSSTANTDDGSCDYSCFGCTDPEATNYDDQATVDDGSCSYDGIIQPTGCLGDLDADYVVGTADLLLLLSTFGLPCGD
jgi:hypothetical protein